MFSGKIDKSPLRNDDYYSKKKRFLDYVNKMIQYNINIKNKKGNSLLHTSVKNDYIDIVYILLCEGISANILDADGNTVLHFVKSKECAELLLNNGVNPNIQNNNGDTPLHTMTKNLDLLNNKGALKYSEIHKYKEITTLFLENGADIYIKNTSGKTYDEMTHHPKLSLIIGKHQNNFILFDVKF